MYSISIYNRPFFKNHIKEENAKRGSKLKIRVTDIIKKAFDGICGLAWLFCVQRLLYCWEGFLSRTKLSLTFKKCRSVEERCPNTDQASLNLICLLVKNWKQVKMHNRPPQHSTARVFSWGFDLEQSNIHKCFWHSLCWDKNMPDPKTA